MCKVEGCTSPVRARGWCDAHYRRWKRNGDPVGGRTPPGETERYFREVVLEYKGNECLLWPYAKTDGGYALVSNELVSRRLCERVHGPAPTAAHQAAHSCGKGHEGCVTQGHLSWKTPKDNAADRIAHGTSGRGEANAYSKLTEADVSAIRALKGRKSQRLVALEFGVDQVTISNIYTGKTWGWLR